MPIACKFTGNGLYKSFRENWTKIVELAKSSRLVLKSCSNILVAPKQPLEVFCEKRRSLKFCKINRKTPESLFL